MREPYVPLPYIDLDPKTEQELLKDAIIKVYQSSGGLLNDFTSSSPTTALLEGQVFAQGQFLAYLNKLPERLLLDWLTEFCGFQRKQGRHASALFEVSVERHNGVFVLPKGYRVYYGSETWFQTTEAITIPAYGTKAKVVATCGDVGEQFNNIPAGSVSGISENFAWLKSVSNVEPTSGGEDLESLAQAKRRAFTILRRSNPVSIQDWADFLEYKYGKALAVTVKDSVIFVREAVSGEALSESEITKLQILIDAKTFISSDKLILLNTPALNVDISITVRQRLPFFSTDDLFSKVSESAKLSLPRNLAQHQVKDIAHLVAEELALRTDGVNTLTEISLENFEVFCNPFIGKEIQGLEPPRKENSLSQGDIVKSGAVYRRVIKDFSPGEGEFSTYVNNGSLKLATVRAFSLEDTYEVGDIVVDQGVLYVAKIPNPVSISSGFEEILSTLPYTRGVHPPLTVFDALVGEEDFYLVSLSTVNLTPSSTTREAILSGLLESEPINISSLNDLGTYIPGEYLAIRDRDKFGFRIGYYVVNSTFTYYKQRDSLSSVLANGFIREVALFEYPEKLGSVTSGYLTKFKLGDRIDDGTGVIWVATTDTNVIEDLILLNQDTNVREDPILPLYEVNSGDYIEDNGTVYLARTSFDIIYPAEVYEELGYIHKTHDDLYMFRLEFPDHTLRSWQSLSGSEFSLVSEGDGLVYKPNRPFITDMVNQAEKIVFRYTNEDTPIKSLDKVLHAEVTNVYLQ